MTAKAIVGLAGVPDSQLADNRGAHCNDDVSGTRRHRAPAAVAFVHDGTVIDVDINGGIELSAYRENEGVASNRPPESLSIPAQAPQFPVTLTDDPDPHGRVAMMLSESLFHLLVEQGVISREKAIEAIDGIAELIHEATERDTCTVNDRAAAVLVETLRESFAAKDAAGLASAVPAITHQSVI